MRLVRLLRRSNKLNNTLPVNTINFEPVRCYQVILYNESADALPMSATVVLEVV